MKTNKFFIVLILVLVSNIAFAVGRVTLRIKPPESDGGKRLITYYVEYKNVKEKSWWRNGETYVIMVDVGNNKFVYVDQEYEVKGLIEGETYVFRVLVENLNGSGQPGTVSRKVIATENDQLGIEVQSGPGLSIGAKSSSVLSGVSPVNRASTTGILYRKEED